MDIICSCNHKTKITEEWILKDIKDFTERKLAVGKCRHCNNYNALLSEKRIVDGKVFIEKISNKLVKRVLVREAKRILKRSYINDNCSLNGWVYGINVQIKNKKGVVTQIRQYSADFKGNKSLVRKYYERISKH